MKKIESTWNECWPIVNILNEVCHGIQVIDFEKKIGATYESVFALLKKIASHEVNEYESDDKFTMELNNSEIEIIEKSFNEVLKQIEEWEFQTRIGVTIQEANAIKKKILLLR